MWLDGGKGYLSVKIRTNLIARIKQAAARDGDGSIWIWVTRLLEVALRSNHPDLGFPALFLDDERSPPDPERWAVARSHGSFTSLIKQLDPIVISFDHDLGADEAGSPLPDGIRCMRALIDLAIRQPTALTSLRLVILHSANPIGRANLRGLLESAQRAGILANVRIEDRPVTSFPIDRWPSL